MKVQKRSLAVLTLSMLCLSPAFAQPVVFQPNRVNVLTLLNLQPGHSYVATQVDPLSFDHLTEETLLLQTTAVPRKPTQIAIDIFDLSLEDGVEKTERRGRLLFNRDPQRGLTFLGRWFGYDEDYHDYAVLCPGGVTVPLIYAVDQDAMVPCYAMDEEGVSWDSSSCLRGIYSLDYRYFKNSRILDISWEFDFGPSFSLLGKPKVGFMGIEIDYVWWVVTRRDPAPGHRLLP
jgi:hypothetical protein